MTIKIMLADDHKMFRETLKIPLNAEADFEVIAEAGQGKQLGGNQGIGHGKGHCRERHHPDFRAFFYHQTHRSGHRPRPFRDLRHHQRSRRGHPRGKPGRRRKHLHPHSSGF